MEMANGNAGLTEKGMMVTVSNLSIPSTNSPVKAHAKGSSFHLPMRLLPKPKRDALFALYAVCRALDDAVDDAPNRQAASKALDQWESGISAMFRGEKPTHPLLQALAESHRQFHFEPEHFHDMLAALRMDADGKMFYPPLADLQHYCYGVASCVGLLSMQIFGCRGNDAKPFAIALGHALQLTNILRDILTDAKIGRVYLAGEWLIETGCGGMFPTGVVATPRALHPIYLKLADAAYQRFLEADLHAIHLPSRPIAPALAMRDVYAYYWRSLRESEFMPPPNGKIAIPGREKAALIGRMASYVAGSFLPVKL